MITHLQQKAFVRKYNSELAIKGYTKLTKASLFQRIENTLKRSRTELKREWASMTVSYTHLTLPTNREV